MTYGTYNLTFILETTFEDFCYPLVEILTSLAIEIVPPALTSEQHTSTLTIPAQSSSTETTHPTTKFQSSTDLSIHHISSWSFVTSLCTFCAVLFKFFLTRKRKK